MPRIPTWFEESVTRFRGRNIYGDPILRVVWGPDQRDFKGRYKYVDPDDGPMNCFVLERWQPAGFFGPRDRWEKSDSFYDDIKQEWVNLKGPFPERGTYCIVCPLWDDGKFISLTESVLTGIREKVRADENFAEMQDIERGYLIADKHQRERSHLANQNDRTQEHTREYWLKNWDKINRTGTGAYSFTPR
jgi:hypothetical protein